MVLIGIYMLNILIKYMLVSIYSRSINNSDINAKKAPVFFLGSKS